MTRAKNYKTVNDEYRRYITDTGRKFLTEQIKVENDSLEIQKTKDFKTIFQSK